MDAKTKPVTEPITTTVSNEEVSQAWDNWLTFHRGLDCDECMVRFFTYCHSLEQSFVDEPLDWDSDIDKFHVAGSTAHRVKLLAGPHYNTVVEAYYKLHPWK